VRHDFWNLSRPWGIRSKFYTSLYLVFKYRQEWADRKIALALERYDEGMTEAIGGALSEIRKQLRAEFADANKKQSDEFADETKRLRDEIAALRERRRTKRAPSPDILVRDTKWQELIKGDHYDA